MRAQYLKDLDQRECSTLDLEMQWKWKAWLHIPQATVHSSLVALAWSVFIFIYVDQHLSFAEFQNL